MRYIALDNVHCIFVLSPWHLGLGFLKIVLLISEFFTCWVGDFFLGFCFPPWISINYDGPVLSRTVPDVITSNTCFCWRLSNWEVLGQRNGEKVIVICWRWGQRGKGCRSRFLPRELGMTIEDSISWAVEEVLVCFQPTCQGSEGSMGSMGRSKEALKLYSVPALGTRLGNWVWRTKESFLLHLSSYTQISVAITSVYMYNKWKP